MHIAFRVDSSTIIGHGHVMRCLTLAHALKRTQKQLTITFISKAHVGNINHLIKQFNYQVVQLPEGKILIEQADSNTWLASTPQEDAKQCIEQIAKLEPIDVLIVDHYAINKVWHKQLKPYCQQLMVIDDLASRELDCDILLDQTLNRQQEQYDALTPPHCQLLLGQNYMLLRDEFEPLSALASERRQQRSQQLAQANILISMGGGDPDNLSALALTALAKLQGELPCITATLVVSSQSKHLNALTNMQNNLPWCQLITDSNNMAELMLKADIAIGASGATAWERCCLGLPSLLTINAENQQLIAKNISEAGASINLGWHEQISVDTLYSQLKNLVNSPAQYLSMVENCFKICDGKGATRVASVLTSSLAKIKGQTHER